MRPNKFSDLMISGSCCNKGVKPTTATAKSGGQEAPIRGALKGKTEGGGKEDEGRSLSFVYFPSSVPFSALSLATSRSAAAAECLLWRRRGVLKADTEKVQ